MQIKIVKYIKFRIHETNVYYGKNYVDIQAIIIICVIYNYSSRSINLHHIPINIKYATKGTHPSFNVQLF